MSIEEKNKRKGIIGTILFHVLLIVLLSLPFMSLTYQDPPAKKEGIIINFGLSNNGARLTEEMNNSEQLENPKINKESNPNEKTVTQTEINSPVKLEETEPEPEPETETEPETEPEPEPEIEPEPEVIEKGLYKKKNTNNDEGNKEKPSNQGNIEGNINSDIYEGGEIGEDGTNYQLKGRKAIQRPKPEGSQKEGKVVVRIHVNRLGEVTYAEPGIQGSTTTNRELFKKAKTAALNTKFEAKESAEIKQLGKIIYNFILQN